jgi:hypothetical protein
MKVSLEKSPSDIDPLDHRVLKNELKTTKLRSYWKLK